jgi:antitoxin (DNA-binding transcriptional repressor) of toxin-antitoxin stability system
MDFLSVREFRASSREIWHKLARGGKMVITNNGKPAALLLDLSSADLEETLDALRQVRVLRLFNQLRAEAERRGFLSEAEVDAEIRAARAKMKTRGKRFSAQGCS